MILTLVIDLVLGLIFALNVWMFATDGAAINLAAAAFMAYVGVVNNLRHR